MPKFTSPVGTAEERASGIIWPGKWIDANPYARLYAAPSGNAYHTGADLNLNSPVWDSDKRAPVYAIADGTVTCAQKFNVWGNIIVIDHGGVYARYAHVAAMLVAPGQIVKQGDQIATIGNADGTQAYHLHFDVSPTTILRDLPNHWPKMNLDNLRENYLNPLTFLRGEVEIDPATAIVWVTVDVLNVRAAPSTKAVISGKLYKGEPVDVAQLDAGWYKLGKRAGYIWAEYTTPTPPEQIKTEYVTADVLNIRALPSTAARIIGALRRGQAVRVTPQSTVWWKLLDREGFIYREFTSAAPPSGWSPPILATMRGVHTSAGGWAPSDLELDLVHRSKIKWAYIAAYELGQTSAISRLRHEGVEQFVFRAAAREGDLDAKHFVEFTAPRLEQYAKSLGTSAGMMIAIHNEPNLKREGAGLHWQNGGQFATWWHEVAEEYRKRFPGAKLGFPAMSPGGAVANVRLDESTFISQATSAINAADWVGVHYYWTRPDGGDINPPVARWKKWFASKPVLATEVGPADHVAVTAGAFNIAYDKFAAAGVPMAAWVLSGAGDWQWAAWDLHNIVVI